MKNYKLIIYTSLISTITLLSGCSGIMNGSSPVSIEQNTLDNDNIGIFNEKNYNDYNISIKEKDTLKNLIKNYNQTNPNKHMIVDKTKEDIVFDYNYECKTLTELMDYIKVTKNVRLVLNRYNATMYELKEQEKVTDIFEESFLIDVSQLNFVDQPIQWDGVMTHEEILKFIEDNFNIPILYKKQINDKEDNVDIKNLKLNKKVSDYSGTLKKIIQKIAIENKLFIKYQQGIIILSETDTRSFSLKIPYLDLATGEMFENITSLQLTPYEDLESQLQTVMSDETKININKSNGTIIIRGNYDDLREAQLVIKNFHEIYSRSIALDVYIYEVDLSKTNKLGVSFQSSDITLALGKLTSTTTPGLSSVGGFNDKLFLNFLNQFGNTRILTKPKLETINGIPVSMKITTKQDYVSNIAEASSTTSNTNTSSTANTTNVEKETVETGFRLGIYPIAQKDGKIKLIIKPLISQLMKIEPYSYGTTAEPKTIQLITTTEKDFSQIININDGEVALISGYMYEKDEKSKDAIPGVDSANDSFLDFIFGTKGDSKSKTEMVIAIKATVIK